MEIYYILLGIAAVITAIGTTIHQGRSSKAMVQAIDELRAELKDHRSRIGRLEDKVL